MKLFEIAEEFAELFDSLESLTESADEISAEEIENAWYDTLEGMEAEFDAKAENIALYIKELSAKSDALDKEIKTLRARKQAADNRCAWLKRYIMECMMRTSRTKIDGIRATITVRNNAESLVIENESALIDALYIDGDIGYLKPYVPEIDRAKVKKYLQSGGELEGCSLVRNKSILIR